MSALSSVSTSFASGAAPRGLSAPRRAQGAVRNSRARVCAPVAGLGDAFRDMMDFEKWAPKSARRWRLRQPPTEAELKAAGAWTGEDDEDTPDMMSSLDERVKRMGEVQLPEITEGEAAARLSFEDVSDADFSSALNDKITQIATSSSMDKIAEANSAAAQAEAEGEFVLDLDKEGMLTGPELRAAIYNKYGKTYDVSFVRRDMPGKTIVALNIMWIHMEQRSFPLTEEEYMDKLDGVCYIVEALGQTNKVRSFMKLPPKPHMGLPARPIVGTAISIQFPDLTQDVIDEWFSPN